MVTANVSTSIQNRRGRASLKSIAADLNVSVMTVSRALNGKGDVSPETRQRILDLAQQRRYRPNALVQALRSGRSGTVGVMISPDGEISSQVIRGIHDELAEHRFLPIVHFHGIGPGAQRDDDELQYIHRLLDHRVDGIILWPSDESVPDMYLHEVWERGIPLVTVDRRLGFTHADFVGTDDELGGRLAAEHLLGLGHRRLAQLTGEPMVTTYAGRRDGFAAAVAECPDATCISIPVDGERRQAAFEQLLNLGSRVTGVFVPNDNTAGHLYEAAEARGVRIGRDLSVVGFADLRIAMFLRPRLTTVRQDAYGTGRQAARTLLQRIEDGAVAAEPRSLRLPPQLIVRQSTAAPEAGEMTGSP